MKVTTLVTIIMSYALILLPGCKSAGESASLSSGKESVNLTSYENLSSYLAFSESQPTEAAKIKKTADTAKAQKTSFVFINNKTRVIKEYSSDSLVPPHVLNWDRYVKSPKLRGVLVSVDLKQSRGVESTKMILKAFDEISLTQIDQTILVFESGSEINEKTIRKAVVASEHKLNLFFDGLTSEIKSAGLSLTGKSTLKVVLLSLIAVGIFAIWVISSRKGTPAAFAVAIYGSFALIIISSFIAAQFD